MARNPNAPRNRQQPAPEGARPTLADQIASREARAGRALGRCHCCRALATIACEGCGKKFCTDCAVTPRIDGRHAAEEHMSTVVRRRDTDEDEE